MKVILSRKGFDSANGGYPSPILPNGRLISLPIPSSDKICYSNLRIDNKNTYFDLMKQLKEKIKYNKNWHELKINTQCHLDPDVYKQIIRRDKEWLPSFGQISGSQTHLENNGVKEGDIFLFFGWFRPTKYEGSKIVFDNRKPDLHVIFSYFQIGRIIKTNETSQIPEWLRTHPHTDKKRIKNSTNAIYIARKNLSWNSNIPGAGVFNFDKKLVLTKEGHSRSKWQLPEFFKNLKITHHSEKSWKKEGYFKSADIGQEFVIEENEKVEEWVKTLIEMKKCC